MCTVLDNPGLWLENTALNNLDQLGPANDHKLSTWSGFNNLKSVSIRTWFLVEQANRLAAIPMWFTSSDQLDKDGLAA